MEILIQLYFCYYLFSILIIQVYSNCLQEYLQHGTATIKTKPYNSIQYECDEGFDLFGSNEAYCFADVWTTPIPTCHAKGCNQNGFTSVENGEIDVLSESSLVLVTCNPGYIMDGESTISCDGQHWSEPLPNCHSAVDIASCNFEHSLCGWTQDMGHQSDWQINVRETDTKRTGPKFDHTLGPENDNGHYIFMESSTPSQHGHYSRLLSPVYPWYKSRRCFQLWYHMLGPEEDGYMGNLEILLRIPSGHDHVESQLFLIGGNQGNEWHKADVLIERQKGDFQIVVQATRGRSHTADISVDDFSFYRCTNDTDLESEIYHETSPLFSKNSSVTDITHKNSSSKDFLFNDTITVSIENGTEVIRLSDDKIRTRNTSKRINPDKEAKPERHSLSSVEIIVQKENSIPTSTGDRAEHTKVSMTTVKEVTLPTSSEFLVMIPKHEGVELSPHIKPITENIEKATESFVIYPADIGDSFENVVVTKHNRISPLKNSVLTTSASLQAGTNQTILFRPEFIAGIAGVGLIITLGVVLVSILIYKRRNIWGRKTSDDQGQVLYTKNVQQNV
ncbi:uncharacterized protein LOC127704268 [Mytilus californianus]|uniref:uncharacterized protein LOC127704268 n=1 Tax=Mytilus californianus TaxID=6549 RepID=UPI0022467897|nr:uncharacterized protein LOC127704268 [Mytilus californianus]